MKKTLIALILSGIMIIAGIIIFAVSEDLKLLSYIIVGIGVIINFISVILISCNERFY